MAAATTQVAVKQPTTSLIGAPTGELVVPLALVAIVVIMVLPLPAFLIDLLLAVSVSLALIILMVGMYTQQPLEFSTFPSVLLVVTLFRLSLNVASTRLILLHGHDGPAAGQVEDVGASGGVSRSHALSVRGEARRGRPAGGIMPTWGKGHRLCDRVASPDRGCFRARGGFGDHGSSRSGREH